MRETLKGVQDIFDERGPTDATATFNRLWSITCELMAKIEARFELTRDPSTDDLESYRGETEHPSGRLAAYAGPEIDWLVHSWIGNPPLGFTNMHVTAWLGPHIDVPHLGIAWGTLPDLWFYIDFNARSDLMLDTEALDKYFEPLNEEFLALRADEGLAPFTSRALYIRQALSDVAICFTTPNRTHDDDRLDQVSELAHRRVDQWLRWVDEAEPVPQARREKLAADDLARRRNIAERDPANVMAVRFFGQEMTDRLVRVLWGGDRLLLRPS